MDTTNIEVIAAAVVGALFAIAKVIVIFTNTPSPLTLWGKIYRVIEAIALIVGKTKQNPPTDSTSPDQTPKA